MVEVGRLAKGTAIGPKLFVTNAKGLGAGPNGGPGHPDPTRPGDPVAPDQYAGTMIAGTLSMIGGFDQAQLDKWTGQVHANDGFDARGEVRLTTSTGDNRAAAFGACATPQYLELEGAWQPGAGRSWFWSRARPESASPRWCMSFTVRCRRHAASSRPASSTNTSVTSPTPAWRRPC